MKKIRCRIIPGVTSIWKSKVLKTMKLTVIILLIGALQSFAIGSYAQLTRLNLQIQNSSVREILSQVEEKSEFYFLYNRDRKSVV